MTNVSDHAPGLDEYLRQFEAYRSELDQIKFILTGSITKRFMRYGTVGCRCQTNPKALHVPYYEWTRKVQGETVSVRLKKKEAKQLMEWIENKRRFYEIISNMEKITLEGGEFYSNLSFFKTAESRFKVIPCSEHF